MFILASESPRRRTLLTEAGFEFKVFGANVAELTSGDTPRLLPRLNAELKADAVSCLYPDDLVLGADTVICMDGEIIGKPRDGAEAANFLRRFSGRTHEVITGMALLRRRDKLRIVWSETAAVTFKTLDDATIAEYLAAVPVLDKAGAYACQERGELIIERIEGDVNTVIGLPLKRLTAEVAAAEPAAAPSRQPAAAPSGQPAD